LPEPADPFRRLSAGRVFRNVKAHAKRILLIVAQHDCDWLIIFASGRFAWSLTILCVSSPICRRSLLLMLSGPKQTTSIMANSTRMTDAVKKVFLAAERRRAFPKQASIENIDLSMLDFGFYYCSFLPVGRS